MKNLRKSLKDLIKILYEFLSTPINSSTAIVAYFLRSKNSYFSK